MSYSWRALLARSTIEKRLPQFHRPTRNGVCRLTSVSRLSANWARVSGMGRAPATSSGACATWSACWLLKENPGDQVIEGEIFTGDGVRLTRGKFWVTCWFERSCERLAPRASVPQSKRLSKVASEAKPAVAREGFTGLAWLTLALVA